MGWKGERFSRLKLVWEEEMLVLKMRRRGVSVVGFMFSFDKGFVEVRGGDKKIKKMVAEKFVLGLTKLGELNHFYKFNRVCGDRVYFSHNNICACKIFK